MEDKSWRTNYGNYPLTVGTDRQYIDSFPAIKRAAGERWESVFPGDLKCVAFLYIDKQAEKGIVRVPIATAFFVLVMCEENKNLSFSYVITARHVLEESKATTIFVRVNTPDGSSTDVPTKRADWFTHDTEDVATIMFNPQGNIKLDYTNIPLWGFVESDYKFRGQPFDKIGGLAVSVSHDVFFVGLFSPHAGKDQNLPIARFGHISRMPTLVTMKVHGGKTTLRIHGYMVECLSWGGHSGSPAFWMHPMVEQGEVIFGNQQMRYAAIGNFQAFLGLVNGHFGIPVAADITGDVSGEIKTSLNAGIGVITPAHFIRELIVRPDVMKERQKRCKDFEEEHEPAATMDIASESSEPPFTQADFESALKKASRKIVPEGKKKT